MKRLHAISGLCSDTMLLTRAINEFIDRFRKHYAPKTLIDALNAEKQVVIRSFGSDSRAKCLPTECAEGDVVRIVLQWHPVWRCRTFLQNALDKHARCEATRNLYREAYGTSPPRVQIAWRIDAMRLRQLVSKPCVGEQCSDGR